MFKLLRNFLTMEGTKPVAVVGCLLLAGLFQGVGLTGLMPLLSIASDSPPSETSTASRLVTGFLDFAGLSPTLGILLFFVVGAIVLKSLMQLLAMRYVSYTVAEVCTLLRHRLIDHLMQARWAFFTDNASGRIANAISLEVVRASNSYHNTAFALSYAIQTLIYAVVALLVSWKVAFAALIVGLSIGASLHIFVRMVKKAGFKQTRHTNELTTQLVDALSNIKPMKAMAKQERFVGFFDRKIDQLRRALRKQMFGRHALKNLQEAFVAIVAGFGFYAISIHWGLVPSELLVLGYLLYQTVNTMGKTQQEFQKALHEDSAFDAFKSLVAAAAQAREENEGRLKATFEKSCALQGVDFSPRRQSGPEVGLDRDPGHGHHRTGRPLGLGQDDDPRLAVGSPPARRRQHHRRRRPARRNRFNLVAQPGRLRAAGTGPVPRHRPGQCHAGRPPLERKTMPSRP